MRINGQLLIILIATVVLSCERNEKGYAKEDILGEWISIDRSDTLDFVTENDFYKSCGYMHHDHYDYHLFQDSIQIKYEGVLMILISPTKHKYSLENDILTIDFTNKSCYGFSDEIMIYEKVFHAIPAAK